MVTTGSQNSASLLAMIRSQAQASINPPAMHLPWTSAMVGFCQIAPAPGNLQVNFLLARKTAMGIGLGKPAPISNRWKINTGRVLAGGPQIVAGREMRAAAREDDDLDRVVLHRAVKGGVEVVGHLQVLRVPRLGPVHHDPCDARLRPFHDDGLV